MTPIKPTLNPNMPILILPDFPLQTELINLDSNFVDLSEVSRKVASWSAGPSPNISCSTTAPNGGPCQKVTKQIMDLTAT